MQKGQGRPVLAVWLVCLLVAPSYAVHASAGRRADKTAVTIPDTGLTQDQKILHALNRLGFGPRPGDAERIRVVGLDRWIERQLNPESLPDRGMADRLAPLETIRLPQEQLLAKYPPPQLLRALERQLTTRMGMDPDAVAELLPEVAEMRERQQRRERAQAQQQGQSQPDGMAAEETGQMLGQRRARQRGLRGPQRIVAELSQAKLLRAIYSERQLEEVMVDFWFNHFNVFIGKGADRWLTPGFERDAIRPHVLGKFRDLLGATAQHPAMLFYLDNWQSADPEAAQDPRELRLAYQRAAREAGLTPGGVVVEILRDRGVNTSEIERRLERMEQAQARRGGRRGGPGRNRQARQRRQQRRPQNQNRQPRKRGLNENYARELLELHTLGVDGGYTQQDVIEVARCFTGWTLTPPQFGQQFVYVDALHDRGGKTVLGQKIKNGGRKDGERVLDLLARHPSTARFVSTKLARRFVSDNPPGSLVEKMAATFRKTDGDILAVLRTLFTSNEFWAPEAVNAVIKTPFEFVVSAARVTGADIPATTEREPRSAIGVAMALRELGQPLYGAQPPTGYKDTADAWVSTGALLNRMKIAMGFATGRLSGGQLALPASAAEAGSPEELVVALGRAVLGREPSSETQAALQKELAQMQSGLPIKNFARLPDRARQQLGRMTLGWLLASPEFQRQ